MIVKVISKEIITPSSPTPKHLNLYHMSLLDHVNSPILMPLIFFYSPNPSLNHQISSNNITINSMLNHLKTSLAITLTKFYPLAGRIKDQNYVVCNDVGVPYSQSRVNADLIDVVHKAQVCDLDKLLPCKPKGPSKLPLAIQINVFECGGIAIGLCINHKVSDAFSLIMFINTWSIIANNPCRSYLLPNFDVSKLFPLTKRVSTYEFESQNSVSKRFTFDEISIRSILTYYTIGNEKVSLGLGLLAFVCSRIVATSQSTNVPYEVSQAVNVRSKIDYAPKKSFYFGNVYLDAIAKPSLSLTTDEKSKIFHEMVEQIRTARIKIYSIFMANVQNGTQGLSFVTDRFEKA
ncbi:hypothetical protein vseg_018109 [Gypsophila vaccaria]